MIMFAVAFGLLDIFLRSKRFLKSVGCTENFIRVDEVIGLPN